MLSKLNGLHNINTPLYNPNNRADTNKINHYIEQNFLGNELDIPESLNKYVAYYSLTDMLDFSRKELSKQISLTPKRAKTIESRWELIKISDICEIGRGRVINHEFIDSNIGEYPVYSSQTQNNGIMGRINTFDFEGEYVTWTTDGIYAGTCFYRNGKFNCTNVCGTLKANSDKLKIKFLPLVLNDITPLYVVKSANPKLMNNVMADIKIPLPPIEIQSKIINEFEIIEAELIEAEKSIEECKWDIERKFESAFERSNSNFKLSNEEIFDVSIGKRVLKNEINLDGIGIPVYSANVFEAFGHINKKYLDDFTKSSVIWGIDGDWMVNCIATGLSFYPTDHCGVLRMDETKILPQYLAWVLNKEGQRVRFSRQNRASIDRIKGLTVQAPPIEEQIKLVAEIEQLEQKIAIEQIKINSATEKKKEIMKKYL